MKKLFSLVLAAALCLSLAACGTESKSTAAPESTAPESAAPSAETKEESKKVFKVGICQLVQHDALDAATKGFRDALTEALGDSVEFDEQNGQGESATCSTILTGFVANGYDLIMANATPALQAAVSATTTIPIVGTSVTDYAKALEMDFDAAKGTGINVTGSSDGVPGERYVEVLLELVPDAKKVSILFCSAEANSVLQAEEFTAAMKEAAPDVTCTNFTFADSNDIQMVVTAAIEGCDALYIPTDNQAASNATIIQNVCAAAKTPVIAGEENMCAKCGLATVSISYYDIGFECGKQAVEILQNGKDPGTIPIAYAKSAEKKFNADFAETIGFSVPDGYKKIGE